ncbi:MAG: glycosyltransferase [Planctomycetota bacterium]
MIKVAGAQTPTVVEPQHHAAAAEPTSRDTAAAFRQDRTALRYRHRRIRRWNAIARLSDRWRTWGVYYHRRLHAVYRFLIPPGQRVLELGCGRGDLLAALEPEVGVGVDFARETVTRAKSCHPELRFVHADVHELELDEKFDYIILSDLLNDVWDVQTVLERLKPLCTPRTRVIINFHSRLWEMPLATTEYFRLAKPTLRQNWLTVPDMRNLLQLTGFDVLRTWQEVLFPLPVPLVDSFFNRFLVKTWPFCKLGLASFLIARPEPNPAELPPEPRVSVVVAARNEEGNVPQIFARVPELAGGTELIFVEGGSTDDTYGAIERAIAAEPDRDCKLFRQPGKGKGDAVRVGFAQATGDIVLILDADLTVAPEDLPLFVDALRGGRGEFINGVRLVYPMEQRAMRFFNLLGNKFFSAAFTYVLGQPVKDTLCGTKVMWRRDYEAIAANRAYFGDFDPFGDFDLLFGAAKLNLRIVDLPIRYRERTYGDTNISRWKHGWILLRMVTFAATRIKFV